MSFNIQQFVHHVTGDEHVDIPTLTHVAHPYDEHYRVHVSWRWLNDEGEEFTLGIAIHHGGQILRYGPPYSKSEWLALYHELGQGVHPLGQKAYLEPPDPKHWVFQTYAGLPEDMRERAAADAKREQIAQIIRVKDAFAGMQEGTRTLHPDDADFWDF